MDRREWAMETFKKREADFETRVALDEELKFKARARRNKLLGLWAASEMGLDSEAADAYATSLVADNVGKDDDEALGKSIAQAFARAQKEISEHRIRRTIEEMAERAKTEIAEGR
jgi:hypothetical protein